MKIENNTPKFEYEEFTIDITNIGINLWDYTGEAKEVKHYLNQPYINYCARIDEYKSVKDVKRTFWNPELDIEAEMMILTDEIYDQWQAGDIIQLKLSVKESNRYFQNKERFIYIQSIDDNGFHCYSSNTYLRALKLSKVFPVQNDLKVDVLEKYGISDLKNNDVNKSELEKLNELKTKLTEAVENEDYEKAATLRDKIKLLEIIVK
ncbi:UvrB/UvrC motif-containing protein [Mariniflexile gromovii]|uniref:UvrB/UvrC motif-containing protein n=1 Tax=Mariniflexile gromovii TaxID=362523 RepID=A0ABS4BW91_9FLAO|nr:UvrB/UvrC motif-containing protein [Mariniflexile gromovii]MBP0904859.1 UvrB/UvrC motif-containing protein [Mariniflexile gromovii]